MNSFDILSSATELQHRLFLEASAGTGKTFTIEHLFVRILLETEATLEQILVVTFTRAATRELKVRIEANLKNILSGEVTFDYLKNLTHSQRHKIKKALVMFERAPIYTIHGFCSRLLQEFAFESSVGLELKEWEETEQRWAVLQFLRTTQDLSPEQLQRLLGFFRGDIDRLVEKLISSSGDKKVPTSTELLHLVNQNLSSFSFFPVFEVFAEIRAHYKGMTSQTFEDQALLLENALIKGHLTLDDWDYLIGEEDLFLEGITSSNLKARTKFSHHPEMDRLRAALLPPLEKARQPRHILQILIQAWHEERKKLSVIHEKISPDDLLHMVEGKLGETPFVEAIRKKYRAVIVDEFQDTDPVQWKIFETLFCEDPTKAVYLIGDPKQSIYAFRKADIYTFLYASRHFQPHQRAMLTVNYRSSKKLIDDLNRLLCAKPWLDLPKLKQTLPMLPAQAVKEGEGGLCFMVAAGEIARGKRWPTPELENLYFFPFIVHEIHRLNLDPQKIAILVKDRYQALRVKGFLTRYQIPCVLYRSGSLGDSLMVELLEELIDACFGIETLSSIKKVLLGPMVKLPMEEMTPDIVYQAKVVFAQLAEEWQKSGFAAFLGLFLKTKIGKETVLQNLLSEEGLYEDLVHIVEKVVYISDPHQLKKSLDLLKVQETEERVSSRPHGIQIMTTHASKGLEFDTVFALGIAFRTSPEEEPEEHLKELDAEKMRQFYVAITRAKFRLYVPLPQENSGTQPKLGEASPIELFWEKAAPHLNDFTYVNLPELTFDLKPYQCSALPQTTPPFATDKFFKPLFLQSFSSLATKVASYSKTSPDDLPPGTETGIILHTILEKVFSEEKNLKDIIVDEVRETPLAGYEAVIETLLEKVFDLPIDGFCLRDIDRTKVIPEMEFMFSEHGATLKGFIDLCFEHQGKFYIIDWKSNALENYSPENIEQAMISHDYLLQGKIYLTALTRYLKLFGDHPCGGAFFVFVRGPALYKII